MVREHVINIYGLPDFIGCYVIGWVFVIMIVIILFFEDFMEDYKIYYLLYLHTT